MESVEGRFWGNFRQASTNPTLELLTTADTNSASYKDAVYVNLYVDVSRLAPSWGGIKIYVQASVNL